MAATERAQNILKARFFMRHSSFCDYWCEPLPRTICMSRLGKNWQKLQARVTGKSYRQERVGPTQSQLVNDLQHGFVVFGCKTPALARGADPAVSLLRTPLKK